MTPNYNTFWVWVVTAIFLLIAVLAHHHS